PVRAPLSSESGARLISLRRCADALTSLGRRTGLAAAPGRPRSSAACSRCSFAQRATVGGVELSEVTPDEFDAYVAEALDTVPEELARLVRNVVVLVEDDAPDDDPDLLGYYDGFALTERQANHSGVLPDRILLFRRPLIEMCEDRDRLVSEIRITVV